MKRLLALLLATMMVFSMAACSEKEEKDDKKSDKGGAQSQEALEDGLMLGTKNAEIRPGQPETTLDPQQVYGKVKYDERMFLGEYHILGGEDGEKALADSISYVECEITNLYDDKIAAVPHRLTCGKHTLSHKLSYVPGRNFLRAEFLDGSGDLFSVLCEYFVEGNTLTLKLVDKLEYNEDGTHVRCIMSDVSFTYTFAFQGRKLTLTNGTDTVEMYSGLEIDNDSLYITVDNYLAPGAEKFMNCDYMYLLYMDEGEYNNLHMKDWEGNTTGYGVAKLEENGLITITLPVPDTEETVTRQMVYFLCKDDGIILTDGDKTYYYTLGSSERSGYGLGDNLSIEDAQKMENLSEDKLQQIVEKKTDLLTDLSAAFKNAGLSVVIDEDSGEIAMDASVLFPVDSYEVSEEGKALLKQFMTIYTGVVFAEKYAGFVSSIMVEGHTDSDGDYDYNMTLSQNRAESVKAYCLSAECGMDAYSQILEEKLTPVGNSSDKPVLDANGKEDKAASRRVAFRFIINLES